VWNDRRLARRAARGDSDAFATIFRRYQQDLYRYCVAILGDPLDAQDALQNTMVKALRSLPGEQRAVELKPWLYRVAHNESIELRRRARPDEPFAEDAAAPGASLEQTAADRGRLRDLLADVAELPERHRGALVMRELAGLDFEEIGAALDTSPAAARQVLYEARRSLQQMAEGREMGCDAVTAMLSERDGRVARRRDLRAHLRDCPDCRAFAESIRGRRETLAGIAPLPAIAAAAIAKGALAGSGGATGAAIGGAAAGTAGSGGGASVGGGAGSGATGASVGGASAGAAGGGGGASMGGAAGLAGGAAKAASTGAILKSAAAVIAVVGVSAVAADHGGLFRGSGAPGAAPAAATRAAPDGSDAPPERSADALGAGRGAASSRPGGPRAFAPARHVEEVGVDRTAADAARPNVQPVADRDPASGGAADDAGAAGAGGASRAEGPAHPETPGHPAHPTHPDHPSHPTHSNHPSHPTHPDRPLHPAHARRDHPAPASTEPAASHPEHQPHSQPPQHPAPAGPTGEEASVPEHPAHPEQPSGTVTAEVASTAAEDAPPSQGAAGAESPEALSGAPAADPGQARTEAGE
jgi:RNA polymerase sigma factor (sigma-70 family)